MPEIKVSFTAFDDRVGRFIFVAVPGERGRYLRTDKSVALVACPFCQAIAGEPCKHPQRGYGGGTHFDRRNAARHKFGHTLEADDVLGLDAPIAAAAPVPGEWMEAEA